ncbi:hypothetical protein MOK15_13220 [Sphingobium sp. BYY-5]|uniref:DUF6891 domain-containing protein n=1 Tax=Sphingobium sp. BYY-5 TaxID=2926400 RepID=UPI001FA6CEA0|nr:hypothetical protein [Sphingobium sp. BYY-5]MCI4591048.1 hypothetical protein [Sphingobium sp. BYY-5]
MFGTLWNRIFGTRATTTEPRKDIPSYDPIEALRDQVRRDVAGGFYDEDAILTNAHDQFDEELPRPTLRIEASAALRAALAEHRTAEQGWTEATDCDRLDAAFAALEEEGVIARQNFTCCGTCGASEIWDEVEAVQKAGEAADGYAFFHMQDTESAVEGHGLYLNYGACAEGEEAAIAIGHRVVEQLEAHGLTTDWDGSWGQRIAVSLDWKKRRGVVAIEG